MPKKISLSGKAVKIQPPTHKMIDTLRISAALPKKDYLRERLQRAAESAGN